MGKSDEIFSGEEEDFESWKSSMISKLVIKKIWNVVSGAQARTAENEIQWDEANHLGFAYITQSLDRNNKSIITREDSNKLDGTKAWVRLLDMFERRNRLGLISLRHELAMTKMKKGERVIEYLNKMSQLFDQILAVEAS